MMALLDLWWVWIALAIVFGIVELLVAGFLFLGFALGALATALILLVLPSASLTLPVLLMIFAALSLVAWLLLRRTFRGPAGQVKTFDHDIND
ncbi:hypothetical protein [Phaeobacter sp.]|uniref:NfeD family protein n=1 Tax=Phaeobacter sp. TaxID=1902409 RepID=UPI0025F2E217|nr:hypothetical protein [Phaeobacter sp.]